MRTPGGSAAEIDTRREPETVVTPVAAASRPPEPARSASRFARPLGEIVAIAAWFLGYELFGPLAPARPTQATSAGQWLLALEDRVGLAVEAPLNALANSHRLIALLSGYWYGTLHFAVPPLVLIWLWCRRPEYYRQLRTALILASSLALAVFWWFPVAPPRLAVPGTVDIVNTARVWGGGGNSVWNAHFVNEYAAMPSLHVGWAAWCALAVIVATRSRWRWSALVYPLLMSVDVMMTGNHYLLDAVAGAALVFGSWAAVRTVEAVSRRRAVTGSVALADGIGQ